jgi:hypothetical protein
MEPHRLAARPRAASNARTRLAGRLVKELRLRGIDNPGDANRFAREFVQDYNRRFGRAPADTRHAHRPLRADDEPGRGPAVEEGCKTGNATKHGWARGKCAKDVLTEAREFQERDSQHPQRRDEGRERGIRRLSRRSVTKEGPHHEPEIERGDVGDVTLADVVAAPQSYAAMRARLARES